MAHINRQKHTRHKHIVVKCSGMHISSAWVSVCGDTMLVDANDIDRLLVTYCYLQSCTHRFCHKDRYRYKIIIAVFVAKFVPEFCVSVNLVYVK